jgi:hypothetical protein
MLLRSVHLSRTVALCQNLIPAFRVSAARVPVARVSAARALAAEASAAEVPEGEAVAADSMPEACLDPTWDQARMLAQAESTPARARPAWRSSWESPLGF